MASSRHGPGRPIHASCRLLLCRSLGHQLATPCFHIVLFPLRGGAAASAGRAAFAVANGLPSRRYLRAFRLGLFGALGIVLFFSDAAHRAPFFQLSLAQRG